MCNTQLNNLVKYCLIATECNPLYVFGKEKKTISLSSHTLFNKKITEFYS